MTRECEGELAVIALDDAPLKTAPDGMQIREWPNSQLGSLAYCTMPVGAVSQPTMHKSFEELWYIVAGSGELWCRFGQQECVSELRAGDGLTIPIGAHFQFRTTALLPLEFVIACIPPWPGENEVVHITGPWPQHPPL